MHQRFFGESRDLAKRQLIELLTPNVRWAVHPMWYGYRQAEPVVPDFLNRYAEAIGVNIVEGGDSANPAALLDSTLQCQEHLFLNPDTGLGERTRRNSRTHVDYDQLIRIVQAHNRQDRLTLIYDQAYPRNIGRNEFTGAIRRKLNRLREKTKIHTVGYLAEPSLKVSFILAATNTRIVTDAIRNMQGASRFPGGRFVDDGCGHVK